MHSSTFAYLKPTKDQLERMESLRDDFSLMLSMIEDKMPRCHQGYKMLAIRALEESAMWANKGITRFADGSPRGEDDGH